MLTPKVTETRRGSAHAFPAIAGKASGPTRYRPQPPNEGRSGGPLPRRNAHF